MRTLTAAIFLTAATLCSSTFAQSRTGTFSIIPKIGTNISNMTNNKFYISLDAQDLAVESKSKAGLVLGADMQYQATGNVAVSLGVGYSRQGYRYADYEVPVATTDEYTEYEGISDCHHNIDYVTIPLMLRCYVARNLAIGAGVQAAFIVDNKFASQSTSFKKYKNGMKEYDTTSEKSETEFGSEFLNKCDFSIPVSISYEYSNVVVAATYDFGLTSVTKSSLPKSRNKVIMFTAGYKFEL